MSNAGNFYACSVMPTHPSVYLRSRILCGLSPLRGDYRSPQHLKQAYMLTAPEPMEVREAGARTK
jgi:hypothetical protein